MSPMGAIVDRASNKVAFTLIFILAFFTCMTLVMVRYA